jgi:hypothetical protein
MFFWFVLVLEEWAMFFKGIGLIFVLCKLDENKKNVNLQH